MDHSRSSGRGSRGNNGIILFLGWMFWSVHVTCPHCKIMYTQQLLLLQWVVGLVPSFLRPFCVECLCSICASVGFIPICPKLQQLRTDPPSGLHIFLHSDNKIFFFLKITILVLIQHRCLITCVFERLIHSFDCWAWQCNDFLEKGVLSDVLVQRCTKTTTGDCFLCYKAKLSVRLNWLHCFLLYNCSLCDKQDPLKQHFKSNSSYFAADPNIFFLFLPIAFYLCVFSPSLIVLTGFSGWYAVFCLLWCTVWTFFLRCWLKKQPLMPQNPLLNLVSKHYVTEKDDCRDPTAICCSIFPWRLNGGVNEQQWSVPCAGHTLPFQMIKDSGCFHLSTTDLTRLL